MECHQLPNQAKACINLKMKILYIYLKMKFARDGPKSIVLLNKQTHGDGLICIKALLHGTG